MNKDRPVGLMTQLCLRQNCSPLNVGPTFQRCTDYVDSARRSSARRRQTMVG